MRHLFRLPVLSCVAVLFASSAAMASFEEVEVYRRGQYGYNTFRIPAVVVSNAGTVLAFAEGRVYSASDTGNINLVLRRSFDDGASWGGLQLVHDDGSHTIGNPVPIVDRMTGTIWVLFCRNNAEVWVTSSNDDGQTWATPVDITDDVADSSWDFVATGPVHGFQTAAGRLIAPSYRNDTSSASAVRSYVIYSDDHGATWTRGGFTSSRSGESTAVETEDGRIYLNTRSWTGKNQRGSAFSSNGGVSWRPLVYEPRLPDQPCQGSVIRYSDKVSGDRNRLLFCNPPGTVREKLSVRVSYDEGLSWSHGRMVSPKKTGYSDLTVLPSGDVGVLYERGDSAYYESIWFAVFDGQWAEGVSDHVMWNFDEAENGTASAVPYSIEDLGGGELHATAKGTASRLPTYGEGAADYGSSSALTFTANSDRVEWSDGGDRVLDFDAAESFTLEAVFRTTEHGSGGASGSGGLVAKDWGSDLPSWWLRVQDGAVRFLIEDDAGTSSSVTGSATVNDGQWHHVAAVRDVAAGELRIYVDHEAVGVATDTTTGTLANDQNLVIGAFGNATREFVGSIDLVRISRGALAVGSFVQPVGGGTIAAFWTFEEGESGDNVSSLVGAVRDVSGNRRHATVGGDGVPAYVDSDSSYGQMGAIRFAEGDGEVVFADRGGDDLDFGGGESFVFEAVIRTTQAGYGAVVAKDYGSGLASWWWRVEDGGRMKFLVCDGPNTSSVISDAADAVNDGLWHHVAAVRDAAGGELRLYVDHQLVKTASDQTTGAIANDQDVTIGDFSNATRPFVGDIDYVRAYRGLLGPDEFLSVMDLSSVAVGEWDFEEGLAGEYPPHLLEKVADASGHGRHLSVQGLPRAVYSAGDPKRVGETSVQLRDSEPDQLVFVDSGGSEFDFDAGDSFTIEAVISTTQIGQGGIVGKDSPVGGAGWSWQVEGNGVMRFSVSDGVTPISATSAATYSINDGDWHHIAAVRDAVARELRLYVDYELAKSGPDITSGSLANDKDLLIGAIHSANAGLDGVLDVVRISAAALPPEDFLPCSRYGDLDCSGSVDVDDWGSMVDCLGGPGEQTWPTECDAVGFGRADLDDDGDVDLRDAAELSILVGE